jgi:hypothetical protein
LALIKCAECNKEISDKATACPGCGCPIIESLPLGLPETVECLDCKEGYPFNDQVCPHCGLFNSQKHTILEALNIQPDPIQTNTYSVSPYSKFNKDELWQKAYNIQYKGSKVDLPEAIKIYQYIISTFPNHNEAAYARKQLEILGHDSLNIELPQIGSDKALVEKLNNMTSKYESNSSTTMNNMSSTVDNNTANLTDVIINIVGYLIMFIGAIVGLGNISGNFRTFNYAGTILLIIGGVIASINSPDRKYHI